MTATAGTEKIYTCQICEKPEDKCMCERYCCLCQNQLAVRVCEDGLMYCSACRQACGYKPTED
jgi:hypothetical protein